MAVIAEIMPFARNQSNNIFYDAVGSAAVLNHHANSQLGVSEIQHLNSAIISAVFDHGLNASVIAQKVRGHLAITVLLEDMTPQF